MYDNISLDCRFKSYGLYAPQFFISTSKSEIEKVECGCGPGELGDYLIPDTLLLLNILEACRIHDWMYKDGESKRDIADILFLINMVRIVNHESKWFLKHLRRLKAMKYYSFTSSFGNKSFNS